ncbi:uncharacterized protein AB675_10049 [Cyphellophora attinorum]|uniref:DUF7626 domain-containing protein n=1 Tax=Cyphellophora attinorum TaxID=1664694 RepID=A0A0N1GZS8_9EURO|nr:uncharacterized protein AB675_10049 [Phialophora attinorum]KPI36684.1 hypothetical protein AB675_10049 [Phialophora attinorum]
MAASSESPVPYQTRIPFFSRERIVLEGVSGNLGSPTAISPFCLPFGADLAVQRPKEELLKEEIKSDNEADEVVVAESSAAHKSKKKNAKARNALPKKISAAKDEVDAILVRMKEAKYLETDIAEHLSKHYDVTYSPKTIGTRYTRLKRAAQAASDKLLDEDQTCWHDGDDEALQEAIKLGSEKLEAAKKKLDETKWRFIADKLKILKPVTNFSARACEERARALAEGTAKPTLESIPDPDDTIIARIQKRRDREAQLAQDAQVAPTNRAAEKSSSAPGLAQGTPAIVAQQPQAPQENLTAAVETGIVEKTLASRNEDVEMAVDNAEIL